MTVSSIEVAKRLPFIDALRGLAALWVALFHLIYIVPMSPPEWAGVLRLGGFGVPLFFIVSAFSLCHTMPLHHESNRTAAFYLRRIFRIAPLFYFMIALHTAYAIYRGSPPFPLKVYFANASFLFNLIPGQQEGIVWASWAVGVEMLFYVAFPLIYRMTSSIRAAAAFFVITIILSAAANYLVPKSVFQYLFLKHLPVFALGILAFRLCGQIKTLRYKKLIGLSLMAAAVAVMAATMRINATLVEYYIACAGLFFFIVALYLCPISLLVNRVTTNLGRVSFSFYLLHPIIIYAMTPTWKNIHTAIHGDGVAYLVCAAIMIAVVTVCSEILYRAIERPGIVVGNKIISKLFMEKATAQNPRKDPEPEKDALPGLPLTP